MRRDPPLRKMTLAALLDETATLHPDRTAVRGSRRAGGLGDVELTYAELQAGSLRSARALIALGVRRADQVAIWGWSSPHWLQLQVAIARVGAMLVPLNPAYGMDEANKTLHASGARFCVVDARGGSPWSSPTVAGLRSRIPSLERMLFVSDGQMYVHEVGDLADTLDAVPEAQVVERQQTVDPQDVVQVQYTSGSTGSPKGAMLTHCGIVNNAALTAEALGVEPGDVWGNPLPMFHVAGANMVNVGAIAAGATNEVIARFTADTTLDVIEAASCRLLSVAPTMLYRMKEAQRGHPRDLTSLELVTVGGAQLTSELSDAVERDWGVAVVNVYGLSETSPVVALCRPQDSVPMRRRTVGRVLPWTAVRIADPVTGEVTELNEPGEIEVAGHGVMLGYLGNEDATRRAVRNDGWYRTGDMGVLDATGVLSIVGRYKEVIIRGGENIQPEVVEACIAELAEVGDVCVVAAPHPDLGETPWAVITLQPGSQLDEPSVRSHVTARLGRRRTPERVLIWDAMPETGAGKHDRRAIRSQVIATSGRNAPT